MKFWIWLAAKLLAVAIVVAAGCLAMNRLLPLALTYFGYELNRAGRELLESGAALVILLLGAGLVWLSVLDQRHRCRVCLRRLRMPVLRGRWSAAALFSPPETESICPYGHGTLVEPEVHLTGKETTAWRRHADDIWRELENLETKR